MMSMKRCYCLAAMSLTKPKTAIPITIARET